MNSNAPLQILTSKEERQSKFKLWEKSHEADTQRFQSVGFKATVFILTRTVLSSKAGTSISCTRATRPYGNARCKASFKRRRVDQTSWTTKALILVGIVSAIVLTSGRKIRRVVGLEDGPFLSEIRTKFTPGDYPHGIQGNCYNRKEQTVIPGSINLYGIFVADIGAVRCSCQNFKISFEARNIVPGFSLCQSNYINYVVLYLLSCAFVYPNDRTCRLFAAVPAPANLSSFPILKIQCQSKNINMKLLSQLRLALTFTSDISR
jgi:hypothetical protein